MGYWSAAEGWVEVWSSVVAFARDSFCLSRAAFFFASKRRCLAASARALLARLGRLVVVVGAVVAVPGLARLAAVVVVFLAGAGLLGFTGVSSVQLFSLILFNLSNMFLMSSICMHTMSQKPAKSSSRVRNSPSFNSIVSFFSF